LIRILVTYIRFVDIISINYLRKIMPRKKEPDNQATFPHMEPDTARPILQNLGLIDLSSAPDNIIFGLRMAYPKKAAANGGVEVLQVKVGLPEMYGVNLKIYLRTLPKQNPENNLFKVDYELLLKQFEERAGVKRLET